MKNLALEITEDGTYGWEATVWDGDQVVFDSSHYGAFSTRQEQKEILAQFRQELGISRFSSVIND